MLEAALCLLQFLYNNVYTDSKDWIEAKEEYTNIVDIPSSLTCANDEVFQFFLHELFPEASTDVDHYMKLLIVAGSILNTYAMDHDFSRTTFAGQYVDGYYSSLIFFFFCFFSFLLLWLCGCPVKGNSAW